MLTSRQEGALESADPQTRMHGQGMRTRYGSVNYDGVSGPPDNENDHGAWYLEMELVFCAGVE